MIKINRILYAFLVAVFPTTLLAQLGLSPAEIDFRDLTQTETVRITYDGRPVLPGEILGIASGVRKTGDALPETSAANTHFSNYSHMFEFSAGDDGLITIKPREELLEVGSYELVVKTVYGAVTGVIKADLRDSIPPRPPRAENLSRFSYALKLPDYVYGQAISIDLAADLKNTYTWSIDGEVHASGPGETSFRAWPEPGVHEIAYVARSPAGTVVSEWSDTVEVSEQPAIEATVRKGYKVPFSAPGGYTQVTWTLDGKVIADKRLEPSVRDTQPVTFKKKGKHVLTCFARGSESGDFQRISWSVTVK